MRYILLSVIFLFSSLTLAQENFDPVFSRAHENLRSPFNLPITVNDLGEFEVFGQGKNGHFLVSPLVQLEYERQAINYIEPIQFEELKFQEMVPDRRWIEVKKARWEGGLGISALVLNEAFKYGLIPFKGALSTMIRQKNNRDEKTPPVQLPKELTEIDNWGVGDYGTFQTYGGIQLMLGLSSLGFNVLNASIGIQNLFEVEILRFSETGVAIKISEERQHKRQLTAGPLVSYGTLTKLNAKRMIFDVRLNLENPHHHQLYRHLLKGHFYYLESDLPISEQLMSWNGNDKSFYFGVPMLAGRTVYNGQFFVTEEGQDTAVEVGVTKNNGYILPLRIHQKFVYQMNDHLVLFWFSEMKKVTKKTFDKRFLQIGQAMGLRGFDQPLPAEAEFGSVISQISFSLTNEQVETMKSLDLIAVEHDFALKCQQVRLSCQSQK
jgi:hypothetical protein